MDDFSYDESKFEHVDEFVIEYKSFFTDDGPEYHVFDFNDACFVDLIADIVCAYDTSTVPLDLKPLLDSLKYKF